MRRPSPRTCLFAGLGLLAAAVICDVIDAATDLPPLPLGPAEDAAYILGAVLTGAGLVGIWGIDLFRFGRDVERAAQLLEEDTVDVLSLQRHRALRQRRRHRSG